MKLIGIIIASNLLMRQFVYLLGRNKEKKGGDNKRVRHSQTHGIIAND